MSELPFTIIERQNFREIVYQTGNLPTGWESKYWLYRMINSTTRCGTVKFKTGEINIICTDLERSLTFYRDVLGFNFVEREGIACRLKCGDTFLLLLPVAKSPHPSEPYCSTATISFDLMVENIEKVFKYLQENGVEFESEWEPGSSRFFIRDPDGLVIEVIEKR